MAIWQPRQEYFFTLGALPFQSGNQIMKMRLNENFEPILSQPIISINLFISITC